MTDFVRATASYERWRATRIPVLAADLEEKHRQMASSPFVLLRGSYYRFLEQFGRLLPTVAAAPRAVVVGDLHIENFGTWRDRDARLCWGINDFDEIDVLPYTLDIVRLATSALLAIKVAHITIDARQACEAILGGWRARIEAGTPTPFVLGDRHAHLYKLASEAFEPPAVFARKLNTLERFEGRLPKPVTRMLAEVAPWEGFLPIWSRRAAGVGSLGSLRIVASGELAGGLIAREAKQIPGPANMWLEPGRKRPRNLADQVGRSRGVAADPWRSQRGKWVLRPLAPDAARLELASLRHRHDESAFLHSMGAEAANIHLITHPQASLQKALRTDADGRPEGWLQAAADTMVALTERDHAAWRQRKS